MMNLQDFENFVDHIFPFSFILDQNLHIRYAGKSLSKLSPELLGNEMQDVFQITRPRHAAYSFESFKDFSSQIFILQAKFSTAPLLFRGQMYPLDKDRIAFLGSPWITDTLSLRSFNLSISDFALHDSVTDMLHIIQIKDSVNTEIQELNKKLERSEIRYRELVEHGSDLIYKLNENKELTFMNKVMGEKLGYDKFEALGTAISAFVPAEWQDQMNSHLNSLQIDPEEENYVEFPIQSESGTLIWLGQHSQVVKIEDGRMEIRAYAKDITDIKATQEELIQARKVAESAQEAEKQFLAHMSHEIRTPLNAILGMVHLMSETELSPKQKEYLEVQKSSTAILYGLISDVLDISKIESGQLEISENKFDLNQLMQDQINTFSQQVRERPIGIRLFPIENLEEFVIGDQLLISQILLNLLGNAVKFTEQGYIDLSGKILKRTATHLDIEIILKDTGIGIPAESLDMIFKPFIQGEEGASSYYGGTGLGLSITYKIIELLQGQISVSSKQHVGTTFTVNLPFRISQEKLVKQTLGNPISDSKSSLQGRRILLAEDNAMNTFYVQHILDQSGAILEYAKDGQAAVDAAKSKPYDIIFMDIRLPKLTGLQATQIIREPSCINAQTPILALSSSAFKTQIRQAYEAGVSDFLSKPFTPPQLLQKVEELLPTQKSVPQDEQRPQPNEFDQIFTQLYAGNKAIVHEMLNIFRKDMLPEFISLKEQLAQQNFPQARELAHKVKPSFSMIGNSELEQEMASLEELCEQASPDAKSAYKKIASSLDLFLPKLEAYLTEA